MSSKLMIYTGPFDPLLRDGVSASFFDLLYYFQKFGYNTKVFSLSHRVDQTYNAKRYIETHFPHTIVSKSRDSLTYIFHGIEINYEILPLSRDDILFNNTSIISKYYYNLLSKYPDASYFSADHDANCVIMQELLQVKSFHYIHSPIAFTEFFKKLPSMNWITNSLKERTTFTNSFFSRDHIRTHTGIDACYWPPYIEKERHLVTNRNSRQMNKIIGFYNAGIHKGRNIVNQLIEQLPEFTFKIMGYTEGIPDKPHVQFHTESIGSRDFYSDLSILVVPSITPEGFSRVIIEALMNGIPVIANNIGGTSEALGRGGILVDVNRTEDQMVNEYRFQINKMLDDENYYRSIRAKALEQYHEYERNIHHLNQEHLMKYFS